MAKKTGQPKSDYPGTYYYIDNIFNSVIALWDEQKIN